MKSGQLRKRITLESRSATFDAYGQQVTTWSPLFTAWAQIEPLSGNQLEKAKSVYTETTHRVTMRWRAELNDVRQVGAYRVVYAGRKFDIGAAMNDNERNREVRLMCSEGLNDGD